MNVKRFAIGIVCAIATGAMALALTGCGTSNTSSSASSANSNTTSSAAASNSAASNTSNSNVVNSNTSASSDSVASEKVSPEELKTVDVQIGNGDYDAMEELSKKIQNGEMNGKVVEIDGYVSNFAKGMSYSVVEKNADGSKKIGTTFVIGGVDEGSYPLDGQKIKLVGKVGKDESGYSFVIHTLPEFVEVQA